MSKNLRASNSTKSRKTPDISGLVSITKPSRSHKKDLKNLERSITRKTFPNSIKESLIKGVQYRVKSHRLDSAKFGDICFIDVVRNCTAGGTQVIPTYFGRLHTKQIVYFAEQRGIDLKLGVNSDWLAGMVFTYKGEVKSSSGNYYSDLIFGLDSDTDIDSDSDS